MSRLDRGGAGGCRSWGQEECEAFVDAHYRSVYRFLFWLTGDRDAAADLTQESFAAFWESLAGRGRVVPDPKAWLYGIARNRWRKRRREESRPAEAAALRLGAGSAVTEEALELPHGAPGPEELLLAAEDAGKVAEAVAGLPPDYREALALRVYEELTYRQIAEALGVSEELARWRVHQARQKVRKALLREGMREETGASA